MITVNNTQYRNLQEQVLQNQDQIELLKKEKYISDLGISIIQATPLESASDLPTNYDGAYGDAYLVGREAPFSLYVWTRSNIPNVSGYWFDFGPLNAPSKVEGPQGPKGDQGPQGVRGSLWYSQTGAPAITEGVNNNDQALDGSTGNVYQFVNGEWQLTGNIRGPQGLQGIKGVNGSPGPQGARGPAGPQGPAGQSLTILGVLTNVGQLPDPTTVSRSSAYLVQVSSNEEHIYVIIGAGTENSPLVWHDAGSFGGGTTITIDGDKYESLDLSDAMVDSFIQYPDLSTGEVAIDQQSVLFNLTMAANNPAGSPAPTNSSSIELPISASTNIAPVSEDNNTTLSFDLTSAFWNTIDSKLAGTGPEEVVINAATTATDGTLTEEQLTKLQANKGAYLFFNNEIYRLTDTQFTPGYLVYTHVGYVPSSSTYYIKVIYITPNNRRWNKSTRQVMDPNLYMSNSQINNNFAKWYNQYPYCNSMSYTGLASLPAGAVNIPEADAIAYCVNIVYINPNISSDKRRGQICLTQNNHLYIRTVNASGVWTDWVRIDQRYYSHNIVLSDWTNKVTLSFTLSTDTPQPLASPADVCKALFDSGVSDVNLYGIGETQETWYIPATSNKDYFLVSTKDAATFTAIDKTNESITQLPASQFTLICDSVLNS